MIAAAPAKAEPAVADLDFRLEDPAAAADPRFAALDEPTIRMPTFAALEPGVEGAGGEPGSDQRLSFGKHVRSVRTEMLVGFGYMTVVNIAKIIDRGTQGGFKFHDEGLFGKDTRELGMDKLVHAHNTYLLTELIAARIRKNTRTTAGTELSGALLASGLMLYSEFYDGFKGGFGFKDVAFNSMGAGFGVLRNTVPGLEEKLDFRRLVVPYDGHVYSFTGLNHYRQDRYLFALELGGFKGLRKSPLRFVELHAGYYATGFTEEEKEDGDPLRRKIFVGVGLNLNQLIFGRAPRSRVTRAASQVLDYWQPPYTYLHANLTGTD
jgi:hypothetical protein